MRLAADPRADAGPRRLGVVDGGSPRGAARHSKAAPPGVPPFPPLRVRHKGAIAKRCSMTRILAAPKPARYEAIVQNGSNRCALPYLPFTFVGFRPGTLASGNRRADPDRAVCARTDQSRASNVRETRPPASHRRLQASHQYRLAIGSSSAGNSEMTVHPLSVTTTSSSILAAEYPSVAGQ
jgi:hypothetical protein